MPGAVVPSTAKTHVSVPISIACQHMSASADVRFSTGLKDMLFGMAAIAWWWRRFPATLA